MYLVVILFGRIWLRAGDCGWFFIVVLSVVVTCGFGVGFGFAVCSWCAFGLLLCVYLINVVLLIQFCGY